jgi:hypothetical protein
MLQIQSFHYFLEEHVNRKKLSLIREAFTVAKVNKIFSGYLPMIGRGTVPKMSVIFHQLTWMIAQEDFIHHSKVCLSYS